MDTPEIDPDEDRRLLEFTIVRSFSYAVGFRWKCSCEAVGSQRFYELPPLVASYEKHLKLFHKIEPQESPF